MTRLGFMIDLDRCTGCRACELACSIENDLGPERSWREVRTFNEGRVPGLPVLHLSMACNHCEPAPCLEQCPARAYARDPGTGAVLLDADRCIGCRLCAWVCPYDAPRFDPERGVMEKCTFCHPRLAEGLDPACVTGCPTGALGAGPHGAGPCEGRAKDVARVPVAPVPVAPVPVAPVPVAPVPVAPVPVAPVPVAPVPVAPVPVARVPGMPRTRARPALRFAPIRSRPCGPEIGDGAPDPDASAGFRPGPLAPAVSLRAEWPLAVFTLAAAILVGWIAGVPAGRGGGPLPCLAFLAAGGGAALVSLLHLGRPLRAWRAVLHARTSWLSREILLFGGFVAAGTLLLGIDPSSLPLHALAALLGFAALFAMDGVYHAVEGGGWGGWGGWRLHSASAPLTGVLFLGFFLGDAPLLLGAAALKGALYAARKIRCARAGRSIRPGAAAIRIGIGLALPAAARLLDLTGGFAWAALACLVVGEAADRAEFYAGLTPPSPAREIASDLASAIARLGGARGPGSGS